MSQTVFIVDDDPSVRDAISLWLECNGYNTVFFEDAVHFIQQVSHTLHGCIIADIRMPGMDGLELQAQLNQMGCKLPLIFITGHGTVPMAVKAMRNGALDYFRKPVHEQQLLLKVKEAFTIDQANTQNHLLKLKHQAQLNSLTNRELQVCALVVDGLANKVIACQLGISQRTVEVHRASLMRKLEVDSLPQLVKRYIRLSNS